MSPVNTCVALFCRYVHGPHKVTHLVAGTFSLVDVSS